MAPMRDARRWDQRYLDRERESFKAPRPFLVEHAPYLPGEGLALDVAMGLGGNAGFLLERGLRVVGVDISSVAVNRARQRLNGLMAVRADLTHFYLPENTFDLIVNFYYLERGLWDQYKRALKSGGVLVMETLTRGTLAVNPDLDPAYLLSPGELLRAFGDMEILVYQEGLERTEGQHPRAVASIVARTV
jgi:tellurite methyltransferase